MAEVAVTAALALIEIVSPHLNKLNSKNLLANIKSMQSWLSSMKAFLEDNYGREGGKMLEDQMDKIRGIAYDIEDVLEEIVLHSPSYTFHHHAITRKIHNFAHHVHHGFPIHGILEKIANITREIEDVKEQTATLFVGCSNLQPSSSSGSIRLGRHPGSFHHLDDEMVGYEKPKKEVMRQLVDGEKSLATLAVNGPSGSGKTTFVKNVFREIQGSEGEFDCHAWVRVSRDFDLEELFIDMLKQICGSRKEPYPAEDGSTTSTKLRSYLYGKRYIVVLDDIWRREDWINIKSELPDAFNGSRIIVTTRYLKLASACVSSSQKHIHSLKKLEWQEGWKLFCRKAFPDRNGVCPPDLKECSEKIVKKCEGQPLAIVAVCGALAKKPRLPNEWKRFHDYLGGEIESDSNLAVFSNALLTSYMDLSTNLKCCFLYFSLFPEDYSVERGRLILLWVAERFAMDTDFKTAEEVAEDYLNELVQRNLVHVSSWGFDSRPKNCRVLNLVHQFIIQKCKEENFASIFRREITSQNQKIRRLSLHNDCTNLPENGDFGGVRSMFLLRLINESRSDFEKYLCKLKLVRVLDLQGAHLTEFPNDITRLTLLRYLSFRETQIKMIPSSIKNLSYLETLDLKQTDVTELPHEISYLHNLRHLFAYKNMNSDKDFDSAQGVKVHKGIDNLTNLQDLSLVKLGHEGGILKDIIKLTQLRKLGLTGLKREHCEDLFEAVELMKNLTTLDLCSTTKEEFLELGEMRNPPQILQHLYLKGRLREFPSWISSLNNLLRIGLKWSKMEYSPLQALERLPNLMEIQLVDCCIGEELIFEASCFKKLKTLVIDDFSELRTIAIGEGAMPELRKMSIRRCPQLMTCPLGLHNLIKVEELTLYDMAEEFIARLKMDGEDREWVKHIPLIHFTSSL